MTKRPILRGKNFLATSWLQILQLAALSFFFSSVLMMVEQVGQNTTYFHVMLKVFWNALRMRKEKLLRKIFPYLKFE